MYQTSPRHIRLFSSSPVSHIRFLLVHFTLSHYVSCTLVFCHKGTSVYLRPPALDCWYTLFPAGPGLYLFLSGYIPISALTTVLLVVLQHPSSFFLAAVICTASSCFTNKPPYRKRATPPYRKKAHTSLPKKVHTSQPKKGPHLPTEKGPQLPTE